MKNLWVRLSNHEELVVRMSNHKKLVGERVES
jgi:hypothetical protein